MGGVAGFEPVKNSIVVARPHHYTMGSLPIHIRFAYIWHWTPHITAWQSEPRIRDNLITPVQPSPTGWVDRTRLLTASVGLDGLTVDQSMLVSTYQFPTS